MKINPLDFSEYFDNQRNISPGRSSSDKFGDILQQALDKSPASNANSMTLPPLQNISNTTLNPIVDVGQIHNLERIEQYLDVLDDYQRQLADPMVNLKDMSPLVARMEEQTNTMVSILDSLPEDGLKDILNRAVITSTVEAIKFNRGDYL